MKNQFKKTFRLLGVLFVLLTISCENDSISETENHEHSHGKAPNQVSFDFFKKTTQIDDVDLFLKSKMNSSQEQLQNRSESISLSDFIIDTTYINKCVLNNKELSFSFRIYPISRSENKSEVYNLVISRVDNQWESSIFLLTKNESGLKGKMFSSIEKIYQSTGLPNGVMARTNSGFAETTYYHCTNTGECKTTGICDICKYCVTTRIEFIVISSPEENDDLSLQSPFFNFNGGGGGGSVSFNSEVNSDTPFLIEKEIDYLNLDPCPKEVFDKVKNATDCDIAQVLAKLNANTSVYKTIIKSEVAPSGEPAQTVWNSPYNYTIYISTDYNGKTKLFIAASMFHEMVHAYFMSLFDDYHNANPPNLNAYNDFAGLFHHYVTLKNPASINAADVHHQQMATDYADAIARALQEYHTGIPVPLGTSPNQIYSDLAWGGLSKTPVFDALFPAGSSDAQRIINRYAAEQTGHPIGQGTPQEQTQIGQPCN
jgi:hypothetical protein